MLSLNIKNTRYDEPTKTIAASLYSWVGRKTALGYGVILKGDVVVLTINSKQTGY